MIDCPSIININRLIDIDCHRLLSTAIDYRFHRLFRSWISLLWELNSFSCKFFEKNLYCCDLQEGRLLPWLQTKNYFIFNCCFNLTCYYATAGISPGICSFVCSWWSTHHPQACRKRQFPINLKHVFWEYIFSRAKLISINFSKLMCWVWFLMHNSYQSSSILFVTGLCIIIPLPSPCKKY